MKSLRVKELIQSLAEKYGYSEKDVKEMVSYQFLFLRNQMSKGDRKKVDFKTIKLPHLGTFLVTHKKVYNLKKK